MSTQIQSLTKEDEYLDPLDLQVRMAQKARSRKSHQPIAGKLRFIKAMRKTRGICKLIAENLGIHPITVTKLLERPDWYDVRELWLAEKARCADIAEDAVMRSIEDYDVDPGLSTQNARWLLSKLRPTEYGDKSTTVLEGGDKPIKLMAGMVDLNQLALPPEIKRQVLNALDAKDNEEREAAALAPALATQVGLKTKVGKGAAK